MAHVEREIALVKVAGTGDKRIEALRMADVFRAKVVDTTLTSFIFEITGSSDKVDRFLALMRECGLVAVGRTGVVAIARDRKSAVSGRSGTVRVESGGRRINKNTNHQSVPNIQAQA